FDQIGHVAVRLEDRTNQRHVLLVERLLDTVQDLLQLGVAHVDDWRRAWHPAPTQVGNEGDRPRPSDELRLCSRQWNGRPSARGEGKNVPTAARRIRSVGRPAASRGPPLCPLDCRPPATPTVGARLTAAPPHPPP